MASPALCQGCVYVLEQYGGIIHCLDAKTGTGTLSQAVAGRGRLYGFAIASGDKVYCVDQNCQTHVIEAGPELQVVATNDLDEMCWASPAVAGEQSC